MRLYFFIDGVLKVHEDGFLTSSAHSMKVLTGHHNLKGILVTYPLMNWSISSKDGLSSLFLSAVMMLFWIILAYLFGMLVKSFGEKLLLAGARDVMLTAT